MNKAIIKREQISVNHENKNSFQKSPGEGKVRVEFKLSKEKLEEQLSAIKQEMTRDIAQKRQELDREQQEMEQNRQVLEEHQKKLFAEAEYLKQESTKKGYDEGFARGKENGYGEGYKQGHEKGQKEFDLIKEEYIRGTKEIFAKLYDLNVYKARIFEQTEPHLLTLIDEIIKKVISEEIEVKPDLILKVIKNSIKRLKDVYNVKLKVNPKHFNFINDNKDRLIYETGGIHSLDIVQDSALHEGGCIIETDYGIVDATLETKMISIMELINKTFEQKHKAVAAPLAVEIPEQTQNDEVDKEIVNAADEEDEDILSMVDTNLDSDDLSFLADDEETDEDTEAELDMDIDEDEALNLDEDFSEEQLETE